MMPGQPQRGRGRAGRPPDLGFHRVAWVRVLLTAGGPRCEVEGVVHRRPVRRVVPLHAATALVAAGVPVVVRRRGGEPAGALASPGLLGAPGR